MDPKKRNIERKRIKRRHNGFGVCVRVREPLTDEAIAKVIKNGKWCDNTIKIMELPNYLNVCVCVFAVCAWPYNVHRRHSMHSAQCTPYVPVLTRSLVPCGARKAHTRRHARRP